MFHGAIIFSFLIQKKNFSSEETFLKFQHLTTLRRANFGSAIGTFLDQAKVLPHLKEMKLWLGFLTNY